MTWTIVVSLVTGLGALAAGFGVHRWWTARSERKKNEAEASRATAEATAALAAADDEHLKTVVDYVVKPLRDEVDRLRGEVAGLKDEFTSISRRYQKLLDWARQVVVWTRWHKDLDPPLPTLPSEISDEL